MDGINEKKWFVYLGDHHEGPFSIVEIQGKRAQGQVNQNSYVWAEGLADWKMMSEVADFNQSEPPPAPSALPPPLKPESTQASSLGAGEIPIQSSIQSFGEKQAQFNSGPTSGAPAPTVVDSISLADEESDDSTQGTATSKGRRRLPGWLKVLLVLSIPVGLIAAFLLGFLDPLLKSPSTRALTQTFSDKLEPYLIQSVEKFPALGKWISPIPSLPDVTPEDYEGLKSAVLVKNEKGIPSLGVALSQNALETPHFYLSSHLPDETQFEVYIEGISDTLVSKLSFSAQGKATFKKYLATTEPFRGPEGSQVPTGEYKVYFYEADTQPKETTEALASLSASTVILPAQLPKGKKLVTEKRYFLGQKKDHNYQERLKKFHDQLALKAKKELDEEIKPFAATLEAQLKETIDEFGRIRGIKKSAKQQALWKTFHDKWLLMDSQMQETFQKWTPESIEGERFYGVLFQALKQTAQSVSEVHARQNGYFTGTSGTDHKSFDIQFEQIKSQAEAALSNLKVKIEKAEQLTPTPNGMPRREGI